MTEESAKTTAERAVELFQRATGGVLKADHRALLIDVVAAEIEREVGTAGQQQ